jgi:hypothetical protein
LLYTSKALLKPFCFVGSPLLKVRHLPGAVGIDILSQSPKELPLLGVKETLRLISSLKDASENDIA